MGFNSGFKGLSPLHATVELRFSVQSSSWSTVSR